MKLKYTIVKLFKISTKKRNGVKVHLTENQNQVYYQHYIANKARKETVEHYNTLKGKTRSPLPVS